MIRGICQAGRGVSCVPGWVYPAHLTQSTVVMQPTRLRTAFRQQVSRDSRQAGAQQAGRQAGRQAGGRTGRLRTGHSVQHVLIYHHRVQQRLFDEPYTQPYSLIYGHSTAASPTQLLTLLFYVQQRRRVWYHMYDTGMFHMCCTTTVRQRV